MKKLCSLVFVFLTSNLVSAKEFPLHLSGSIDPELEMEAHVNLRSTGGPKIFCTRVMWDGYPLPMPKRVPLQKKSSLAVKRAKEKFTLETDLDRFDGGTCKFRPYQVVLKINRKGQKKQDDYLFLEIEKNSAYPRPPIKDLQELSCRVDNERLECEAYPQSSFFELSAGDRVMGVQISFTPEVEQ